MTREMKLIVGGVIATLVLVFGAATLLSGGQKEINRKSMAAAGMSLDRTFADLGTMKGDEERTAQFVISNTSENPLRIWNVTTSCDCTFAVIKIGDKEAGEFSMHAGGAMKNWMGEVPAGKTADLSVIYRPKIMPVVGKVSRQASFYTNDPKNQRVEVSIEANVE